MKQIFVTRNAEAKKKKKYLELYKECVAFGKLPDRGRGLSACGLCCAIDYRDLALFEPDVEDLKSLFDNGLCFTFWASDLTDIETDRHYEKAATFFSPTRQNIILFLAAMNNEL